MNIGEPWPDLEEAELRVRVMQTKLHQWDPSTKTAPKRCPQGEVTSSKPPACSRLVQEESIELP
jgi:hypothetical protein